jgi:LuxR family transcriptional regulator
MSINLESELKINCESQLLTLGNHVSRNLLSIEEIGDYIPGSVMVQDLVVMTNTYMNKNGCDYLRQSKEELFALGPEYFERFFPPDEMKMLKAEMQNFVRLGDVNKINSFFQRVRPDHNSDYQWFLTSSRLYPGSEGDGSLKMFHVAVRADMLSCAGKTLGNLVDIDLYARKNYRLFDSLSAREKQIIALIAEGETSALIADKLFLSIHTVNNHRKNILHKLEISSISQLIKFAIAFGII